MHETTEYPKVLIIGETFHNKSGGGITLTNLFYDWPKNKLAVAMDNGIDSDFAMCENYYSFGDEEQIKPWPFTYFSSKHQSGFINRRDVIKQTAIVYKKRKTLLLIIRDSLKSCFNFFLILTGFSNFFHKTKVSEKLLTWINDFNPDIIYFQINTYRNILLINELYSLTKIPIAIHPMDDYISTINKPNLLYYYWGSRIDKNFKILIRNSSIYMGISDSMGKEYFRRYNKIFHTFHNPVTISNWEIYSKKNWNFNKPFRILYAGRYGSDNGTSLHNLCSIVDKLYCNDIQIEIDLRFCTTSDEKFIKSFKKYTHTHIEDFVSHDKMPELLSGYDLLFLPLAFDDKSVRFTKLSMPTKVSEYMISGTPILVYASRDTALCQYASEAGWAYIVASKERGLLENALRKLCSESDLRKRLGQKAMEVAKKNHDAEVVRARFKELLSIAAV